MGKNTYGLRAGGSGWARGVFRGSSNPSIMPKLPSNAQVRGGRRVIYVPNHESFAEFILSDQVRDPTEEVAKDIAAVAKGLSPVSNRGGDQDGRRMRDQFSVIRSAGVITVAGNPRVLVEVINPARSAAPNEFGTKRTKRHRMLGRAGAMFGDFKPEGGPTT